MPSYYRVSAVGGIYKTNANDSPQYLGSCASLGLPTHFVTAAHCVTGVDRDSLVVNHSGITKEQPFTPVLACHIYEPSDVAVVETEVPEPRWTGPFEAVGPRAPYPGSPVTAIGSSVGLLTEPNQESLRVHRGFIQRPFFYEGRGQRYPAYELSFPSAPGLSGAAVFADEEPKILLGVMTENFRSYTRIGSELVDEQGTMREVDALEVVTYGVATSLWHALDFLEEHIPGLGT